MYLAKVTGALVSTTKHASLNGAKLLIVARLDEHYQHRHGAGRRRFCRRRKRGNGHRHHR